VVCLALETLKRSANEEEHVGLGIIHPHCHLKLGGLPRARGTELLIHPTYRPAVLGPALKSPPQLARWEGEAAHPEPR
jgi:hypothetical protein